MKVEIWSDVVCPWCYIGKRRFEAALRAFDGREDVEVEWRSFQLNPDQPKGAVDDHDDGAPPKTAKAAGPALDAGQEAR